MNPVSRKYSVGFTIAGKLNRTEFEVGKDASVVGEEIVLKSNAEFIIN